MIKFFKQIKTELFFIYKLFNPKYTPVCRFKFTCYLNYFKNRFCPSLLIRRAPVFKCEHRGRFEIHVLCQRKDIWPLIWALGSFLFFSKLCPNIIIHDDGSFKYLDAELLKSKFNNLEVITRNEADEIIYATEKSEKILEYRRKGHPLIIKLIDIFLLSKSDKIMVLDSDVLFFQRPGEIIDFVNSKTNKEALISGLPEIFKKFEIRVDESYIQKYDLLNRKSEFMNSGIIVYNKQALTPEKLEEYFEHCLLKPNDYFVEMTGWNSLIAQLNYEFLSLDRYILKGQIEDQTVAKHFTSGRRQELYAYGIDIVRNKIKSLNNKN